MIFVGTKAGVVVTPVMRSLCRVNVLLSVVSCFSEVCGAIKGKTIPQSRVSRCDSREV